jgi:esterase
MRLLLLKNLYRNENKDFAWRFNIESLLDTIENIQEADFITGNCAIPTHFLRGGNSDYINSTDKLIINKYFSDFSIATFDGAGHCLHTEQPETFYEKVSRFCLL